MSEEDNIEEKKKIKELGLQSLSEQGFSNLLNATTGDGAGKEKDEKKPVFRGF